MADDQSNERERPAIRIERFWTDYERDPERPGEMRGVDWVEWIVIGAEHRSSVQEKVARVRGGVKKSGYSGELKDYPPGVEWAVVGPAYDAWKKGEEAPVDGTPLDAWPGLNAAQAKALRAAHILSVEDAANMNETQMGRVQLPGVHEIKRRAQAFVAAKGDRAKIEEALASRDAQIAAMQEQLAELLSSQPAGEKRGPGRPPKAKPEAEAA